MWGRQRKGPKKGKNRQVYRIFASLLGEGVKRRGPRSPNKALLDDAAHSSQHKNYKDEAFNSSLLKLPFPVRLRN